MLPRGVLFWMAFIAMACALFAVAHSCGEELMRTQEAPVTIPQSEPQPEPVVLAPVHRCQAGDFVYYNSVC
jgi:hypothetical protein